MSEPFKAPSHVWIQQQPFTIGRGPNCHLVLGHPSVSKRHAEIEHQGGGWVVRDLGSKNGTAVNGVPGREHLLSDEDLISLGGQELLFREAARAQLDADLAARFDKLHTALRVTARVSGSRMLDQIMDQVMAGLMQLTRADRGVLLLADAQGNLEVARSENVSADEWRSERGLSTTAIERAIATRQEVVLSNATRDTFFGVQHSVVAQSLKTLVCVPILVEDQPAGLLYADSDRREQGFTQIDVDVLQSLATSAAIALQNQQLNEQVRSLVQEASEVLSQVERAASLEESLRLSIRQTLTALSSLRANQPALSSGMAR